MTTNPATELAPTTDQATSAGPSHAHTRQCSWDLRQARWSCEPPLPPQRPADRAEARAEDSTEPPMVDVRDMLVVHTALLRELRLAPGAVGRVADGDTSRAGTVGRHVRFLLDLLHHHHEGEDALLWPVLRDRVSPAALAVLAEGEEQHGDLDTEIDAVRRLLGSWLVAGSRVDREALRVHLEHLHALLADHLDLEERSVLPLAAAVLTQDEWDAAGAAGAAGVGKADLPLVLGMFAYEGDPAVVRQMLGAAPRLVRGVLPPLARRAYARRAREVHGTSRP